MKILEIGEGREARVLDVPVPEPGPGEALLRIEAVTTCPQWDLHLRHNEPMFVGHHFHYPYTPGQPGHESTGTVEAIGEGVTELAPGDRVSAWRDAGHDVPGCYAQYVVHRAQSLIRVPAHLPAEATAPVELAMCVGAAFLRLKKIDAVRGRRFAVGGLGPAGLIAAQMARAEGAASVFGFDTSAARREYATRCGLDGVYDPVSDPGGAFPALAGAAAIDAAIDCVGAKTSVEFLMDRTGDVLALFGVQREEYAYGPRHWMAGLTVLGYPGHSREAAEYAVGMLERKQLDLARLVTHHLPLECYAEGIDLLERQEAIKVCFWPWRQV